MWTDEQVERAARAAYYAHKRWTTAYSEAVLRQDEEAEYQGYLTTARAALDAALGDTHVQVDREAVQAFADFELSPKAADNDYILMPAKHIRAMIASAAALTPPREPSEEKTP